LFGLTNKSKVSKQVNDDNVLQVLELRDEEYDNLISSLIGELPNYYVDPQSLVDTLRRLGKNAAAKKLKTKLPETKKIRSGDVGEIMASDYIEEATIYSVPIRKLRWRDHREMAMRGDDTIGLNISENAQTIRFLKAEAKSIKSLSRKVLQKARDELDLDDGLPAPHALEFVAERLRETGNQQISDLIEKVQLVDGIDSDQVEHLLFTFTASNPSTLQKEAFDAYSGDILQSSIGLKVAKHQELIAAVFQGVIDGLNN